tara:strand:+ start:385 stop:591 length:207 start_codon:yes stop_codon:yes gene_type:complete
MGKNEWAKERMLEDEALDELIEGAEDLLREKASKKRIKRTGKHDIRTVRDSYGLSFYKRGTLIGFEIR